MRESEKKELEFQLAMQIDGFNFIGVDLRAYMHMRKCIYRSVKVYTVYGSSKVYMRIFKSVYADLHPHNGELRYQDRIRYSFIASHFSSSLTVTVQLQHVERKFRFNGKNPSLST
jgi:hypothetical protein